MSQIRQINVNCPLAAPSTPRGASFNWVGEILNSEAISDQSPSFKGDSPDDLRKLSMEIFERPNVLSILRAAFSKGLTRDTVWDLDGISQSDLDCYVMASRVYKRGVSISCDQSTSNTKPIQSEVQKNYKIHIVKNIKDSFESLRNADLVVIDRGVANYFADQIPGQAVTFEFSESNKNIQTLSKVISKIRTHLDEVGERDIVVHAVGGGVAGDMVGFAAGLLGLKTRYVPTTLLSMIDSSVGGKVGVNFEPWGKNQLGLFHQPVGVSVCPQWLHTLPADEFKAGISEALKHALLVGDSHLWRELLDCTKAHERILSAEILAKVIGVKVDVVSRDPWESSERVILNFGHTLGHVVESLALKKRINILHGQCVALGMVHALRLSRKYFSMPADSLIEGLLESGILPRKEKLIEILEPLADLDKNREEILDLFFADKKSRADNRVRFVLLKAPGVVARGADGSWTIPFGPEEVCRDFGDTLTSLMADLK